jgi:TM2 domain-containing membrane protein YozV
MGMKKPFVAFLLSFLLPGAGLAYLGKWKWAIFNLLAVLAIGVLFALALPDQVFEQYSHLIAVGCSSGSAALARVLAMQQNQRLKAAGA